MAGSTLFGRDELSRMRDRTTRRNYSPEVDAFRRDHQRRRDHGKARRHAERIYRAFRETCDDEAPPVPPPRDPTGKPPQVPAPPDPLRRQPTPGGQLRKAQDPDRQPRPPAGSPVAPADSPADPAVAPPRRPQAASAHRPHQPNTHTPQTRRSWHASVRSRRLRNCRSGSPHPADGR
jgi:hypothetical protein